MLSLADLWTPVSCLVLDRLLRLATGENPFLKTGFLYLRTSVRFQLHHSIFAITNTFSSIGEHAASSSPANAFREIRM